MANESFKVLEIFDGVEYVFNCNTFRDAIRRMSRLAKKNGVVGSVEAFREDFAEKIMVSSSALKQWESGRNGVSDLERVKEIARHLLMDDYHKLLMPRSNGEEKENSVMMNRMIDEKEREVARNIFEEMTEYIYSFEESWGFEDFNYAFEYSSSEEVMIAEHNLDLNMKKIRFDLPKMIADNLADLFREIGYREEEGSSVFETEEYAKYVKDTGAEKIPNDPYVKAAYCSRKADEYYEKLCGIMKEYLK